MGLGRLVGRLSPRLGSQSIGNREQDTNRS